MGNYSLVMKDLPMFIMSGRVIYMTINSMIFQLRYKCCFSMIEKHNYYYNTLDLNKLLFAHFT